MKQLTLHFPRFFGVFSVVVLSSFILSPGSFAHAAFQLNGANIMPTSPTDFGSASMYQSLRNLAADHANEVTLVIPLGQSNDYSTDVSTNGLTPTDASLVTAIQEAHSLGMSVALKPQIQVATGDWEANVNPSDRTTWFTNYGNLLVHYAQIGQAQHAEEFVMGTELIQMASSYVNSTNTQNWNALIARVRAVYGGQLTYASNWGSGSADEMDQIQFWNNLDVMGVDYYMPYNGASESVSQMESEEQTWNQQNLAWLVQQWGKPVQFIEAGYRSVQNANTAPFDWSISGPPDMNDQANAYQALFGYWSTQPFMKGITLWRWNSNPNSGGTSDTDYTPQGKPAEQVMANFFGGTITNPSTSTSSSTSSTTGSGSGSTGSGNGSGSSSGSGSASGPVSATALASASSVAPNTPVTLTATVSNTGSTADSGLIIDTEVYSGGTRVYQNFEENQSIAAGGSTSFASTWTPTTAGTYTVEVGVFTSGWAQALAWNGNAASVTVTSGSGSTSSTPSVNALSATATSLSGSVGSPATISATFTNSGSTVSNMLVDTEVYDANGNKVFQNFAGNQTISGSKQYASSWTPSASGIFRIALGIFSNDWSHNYLWVNQAGTINVGGSSGSTGSTGTTGSTGSTGSTGGSSSTGTSGSTGGSGSTGSSGGTTSTPHAIITPSTATARAGTSIDFTGSNFDHEQTVTIKVNGTTLSSAHADGGGNFSTGSLSVTSTPGTYTYSFTDTSGASASATVQVTS